MNKKGARRMLEPIFFFATWVAIILSAVIAVVTVIVVIETVTDTIIADWPENIRGFFR